MTELYNDDYLLNNDKQKFHLRFLYEIITAVVLAIIVTLFILYANTPYGGSVIGYRIAVIVVTFLFAVFSFAYFIMVYNRVKRYVSNVNDYINCDKVKSSITFLSYDENVKTSYGLDYVSFDCLEWSEFENDYIVRNVLVDNEIEKPNFTKGQIIVIFTYSNVLCKYDIMKMSEEYNG